MFINVIFRSCIFVILILLLTGFARERPAYQIFNADGELSGFTEIMEAANQADIVFFGELHNNPVAHWIRQEMLPGLLQPDNRELVIGTEMFERDNQLILDEYLQGWLTDTQFENEAKLWRNYETDYRPIVKWAAEHDVPLIATNIPRRYAAMVARNGLEILEILDESARKYFAPLPVKVNIELRSYREILEMSDHHGTEEMVFAQAIKNATMAHSILSNFTPGKTRFFHLNGAYHTMYGEGIIWYLEQELSELEIVTLSTVEQVQLDSLDTTHFHKADFLLVVPDNMIKTH